MLDLSKVKWDMSPEEKYAVKWFNDHGKGIKSIDKLL